MEQQKPKQIMEEFESMRNMAELKALSNVSQERPLTDDEYNKMMMLKNQFFPVSDKEFKESLEVEG